jgi:hypothetical protein
MKFVFMIEQVRITSLSKREEAGEANARQECQAYC